jgi:ABC-type antimicrobial peptide transport system permease subunit
MCCVCACGHCGGGAGVEEDADSQPSFAVRATADPLSLVPELRGILRQIDAASTVDGVTTLDRVLAGLQTRPRFYAVFLTILGIGAAVIAAIGIYGVLAYGVAQRTREIGIRLAFGARPVEVMAAILSQAVAIVGLGIAGGLLAAAGAARYLSAMLFGLTPLDAPTYAAVAALVALGAAFASSVPALRATRVNPLAALRHD